MKKQFRLSVLSVASVLSVCLLSGCLTNHKDDTITTSFDAAGVKTQEVRQVKEDYLATTYKTLNLDIDVYAVAASFYDPVSGSMSPYLKLGIFKEKYYSIPVVPGQPVTIVDEEYSNSWWNWTTFFSGTPDNKTNLIRRRMINIGNVPDAANSLEVKYGSGAGITIDKSGVSVPGAISVKYSPSRQSVPVRAKSVSVPVPALK